MNLRFLPIVPLIFLMTACAADRPMQMDSTTPDPLQPYVDANASKGTAVAAVATAEYFSMQITATVEARNQIATQQAASINSLATERAWNATSTADAIHAAATASAVAQQAIWTQRAMDITATANSAAVQAYATQQYSLARNEELSIRRKEMMNSVAAIVPWSVGVGTFVVIVIVFIRWSRVRVIQRDPRGDAPLLLNVVDGVAYDFDRHPTSTGGVQREDIKLLPKFSASDHTQTTERDQMLDLATRGLPGASQRKRISNQLKDESTSGDDDMPQIETIDANSARPLFKDVIPHIVQDSIDAEIISQEEAA